jgi:hypothetical protein
MIIECWKRLKIWARCVDWRKNRARLDAYAISGLLNNIVNEIGFEYVLGFYE